MDPNWRHGVAAIGAAAIVLALLCSVALAGGFGWIVTYTRWLERTFGDTGIIGLAPPVVLLVAAPGALWYALALALLRLFGERQ